MSHSRSIGFSALNAFFLHSALAFAATLMAASPVRAATVSSNGGAQTHVAGLWASNDGWAYSIAPDAYDGQSYNTGNLAAPAYSNRIDLSTPGLHATATATTQVYVTPGTIKASVAVTASGNDYLEGYDWGDPVMVYQGADASARVAAAYTDVMTVLGPAGQSGLFQVDLSIERTYTGDSYATLTGRAMVRSMSDELLSLIDVTEYATSGLIYETRTVQLAAGSKFLLVSDLQMQVSASSTWVHTGTHSSGLDASNTSHMFIEALTPGFSLTTESGAPYSPVPVPGALWLLGSALGGLGVFRRSRKSG